MSYIYICIGVVEKEPIYVKIIHDMECLGIIPSLPEVSFVRPPRDLVSPSFVQVVESAVETSVSHRRWGSKRDPSVAGTVTVPDRLGRRDPVGSAGMSFKRSLS